MDEKEFLLSSSDDIFDDEQKNLESILKKIALTIQDKKKYKDLYESFCEEYRGEYQHINEFRKYSNKIFNVSEQIEELEDLSESPYYAHIYLENSESDENIFVGYNDIHDKSMNVIVHSWQSAVGDLASSSKTELRYNGNYYKTRYKRNVSIEKKELIDCVETYSNESKNNNQITDYFLRKLLKSKKSEKGFTDIVKSIQENQNEIIRKDNNSNVICQGVAGSGKTAIIVHRLSFLLYNYPKISPEKYLFIAPNDKFKQELSELNKKLGIDKIKLNTLYEYYLEKINHYLGWNFNNLYEINTIIKDQNLNINYIYSEENLKQKYKKVKKFVYDKFDPFFNKYEIKINDELSINDNIVSLKQSIEERIRTFLNKKNELFKEYKSIMETSKYAHDSFIENDNNNLTEKIEYYKRKVDLLKKQSEKIIEINESQLKVLKTEEHYKICLSFDFSKELIEQEIKSLSDRRNEIVSNNDRLINSIIPFFFREAISKNNEMIEELNSEISFLEECITFIENSDYRFLENEKQENKNNILVLEQSLVYAEKILQTLLACKKLIITSDIGDIELTSFKTRLNHILNYTLTKTNLVNIDKMQNIINSMDKIVRIDSTLDYNTYLANKKDLDNISKQFYPSMIIKECFENVLDNKYIFKSEQLQKQKFYRNDIFVLLYILDKVGFKRYNTYKFLYIDEAQDYNDQEIKLIYELENNPIINIYGDYNQNISDNSVQRNDWKTLIKTLNTQFEEFELKENYRNTLEVVNYCNKILHTNMFGIGVSGNKVEELENIQIMPLIEKAQKNDSIIITNELELIKKITELSENTRCYSVYDVKGLEFDNVIVIDKGLDTNNKYVAYTRTKNDLTIIHNVTFKKDIIENDIDVEKEYNNIQEYINNNSIDGELLNLYFSNNFIPSEKQKLIHNYLLINGIKITGEAPWTNKDINEKYNQILDCLKHTSLNEDTITNILKAVSNDVDERDILYEKLLENGKITE